MKELLHQVIKKLQDSYDAMKMFEDYGGPDEGITFRRFNNATGNHCFDDHPEVFGITKNEGHSLRAFFQEASGKDFEARVTRWILEKTCPKNYGAFDQRTDDCERCGQAFLYQTCQQGHDHAACAGWNTDYGCWCCTHWKKESHEVSQR